MANKYLKFEYWNTCDLGNIYYQGGQHFWFFLDGDIGEPFYEEVEDGQENGDGDFVPTYRRQIKKYLIKSSLVPDYLVDAMKRMELHDHIELTWKTGEVEQIYNVSVEPEWQFEKYCHQATVTITFDMDEKITVGTCCDNLTVGEETPEPPVVPDLYWVAETGSDVSGDGSYTNPWATFGYASTQATVSGDVIHMKAGTITETIQSSFAVGVSIVGQGDTSIIKAGAALDPMFLFSSATEGTNGNQSISYVKMDGDLTGLLSIGVYARSNVKIHHCTIVDFAERGVTFRGKLNAAAGEPTTYATSNEFYNNTVTNSAMHDVGWGRGALNVAGQNGILIHDNTITQLGRAAGTNGYAIKASYPCEGHNRGVKIYDNTLQVEPLPGAVMDICIEFWNSHGGIEIYDNDIQGTLDMAGQYTRDDYAYGYACRIHDNTIGQSALSTLLEKGITFEGAFSGGTHIYHNLIQNLYIGISLLPFFASDALDDIYIHYNIIKNIGVSGTTNGKGIFIQGTEAGLTMDNINIFNNVIDENDVGSSTFGIDIRLDGTITDLDIRNNIITKFNICVYVATTTITGYSYENNNLYGNGNSNDAYYDVSATITDDVQQNNIKTDPAFVTPGTNYHLQAGSGCINAGLVIGMFTDYYDMDGVLISGLREIGAYQYIP